MSRTIKFRAYEEITGTMSDPFTLDQLQYLERGGISLAFPDGDIHSLTATSSVRLMQYTGLRDVNGVEIYENYVLGISRTKSTLLNRQVVWREGQASFGAQFTDQELSAHNAPSSIDQQWIDEVGITVIGNIFEHEDLIQ